MAELTRDRERAAKLRTKKKAGKPLTHEQRQWLDAYETRVTIAKAKAQRALPSGRAYAASSRPTSGARTVAPLALPSPSAPPPVDKPTAPDLTEPQAVVVHETVPVDGNVAPDAATWTPTVPAADPTASAEPPPPGAPPPPTAGSPLVDDAAPAAPQGDEAGAAQFAGFIMFITTVGIESALVLAKDAPIPPRFRMYVESDKAHAKVLEQVGAAAHRLGLKWGIKSIPLADEAVVLAAVAGSALAFVAVQKRELSAAAAPTEQATEEGPPKAPGVELPSVLAQAFAGQS